MMYMDSCLYLKSLDSPPEPQTENSKAKPVVPSILKRSKSAEPVVHSTQDLEELAQINRKTNSANLLI